MKTIREWLETLDEPYRSQALANTTPGMLDSKRPSLAAAISVAFSWMESNEGYDYWLDIWTEISSQNRESHKKSNSELAEMITQQINDSGGLCDINCVPITGTYSNVVTIIETILNQHR